MVHARRWLLALLVAVAHARVELLQTAPEPDATAPERDTSVVPTAVGNFTCARPTRIFGGDTRESADNIGFDRPDDFFFMEIPVETTYELMTCNVNTAFNSYIHLYGPSSRSATVAEIQAVEMMEDGVRLTRIEMDVEAYTVQVDTCMKLFGTLPAGNYWVVVEGREVQEDDLLGRYRGEYRINLRCGIDLAELQNDGTAPAERETDSPADRISPLVSSVVLVVSSLLLTASR